MSQSVTRLVHRHDAQDDLVFEIGKPVPDYYRRPGRIVVRIDDSNPPNPLRAILDDGEVILVGHLAVISLDRA